MGDMEEATTAMKKANSVLYLALGMAARKTISDKFPTVNIATTTLVDLLKTCKDCFEKPKNETLDRFKFLSRKQKENETLRQFWNEPIRERKWIKLQRNDKRSKSAHWPIQSKQTDACENTKNANSSVDNKMGQSQ